MCRDQKWDSENKAKLTELPELKVLRKYVERQYDIMKKMIQEFFYLFTIAIINYNIFYKPFCSVVKLPFRCDRTSPVRPLLHYVKLIGRFFQLSVMMLLHKWLDKMSGMGF